MKTKPVYNLEFPEYVNELKIGNYTFRKDRNYKKRFLKLHHLVNSLNEFDIRANQASHQITASVEIPEKEKPSVPGEQSNKSQLNDILLLLSLFTQRNVFIKDWRGNASFIVDSRHYQHGGTLRVSMSRDHKYIDVNTGKIYDKRNNLAIYYLDIGFEKTINEVLSLVSSKEWLEKYANGYFLFLFKQAMQWQMIETSFILCWAMWEHIFSLENSKWLDRDTIEKTSGDNKIAYVMNKYFNITTDDKSRKQIKRITKARNRIIHFGKKTENVDYEEMALFVKSTEDLVAIILGLKPANILNTEERRKEFLKGNSIKGWLSFK